MSGYVSNPFQVLGKSDPPAPIKAVDQVNRMTALVNSQAPGIPANVRTAVVAAVLAQPTEPSHPSLKFLHEFGSFLLTDVLPILLQVGLPILEKRV